jgi:DNA-binding NarL/FixJ family response regulator
MSTTHRIRILVLHGDPVMRAGLAAAFGSFPDFEVRNSPHRELGSSQGGALQQYSADVVVADYLNGVALATFIARQGSLPGCAKVVVVTGLDREREIRSALESGVRGYLIVGCAIDELAAGVRAAHRGVFHLSPQIASRLADSIASEALTAREEQVLRLVVAGHCNKTIGRQLGIAVGTVKSHLKSTFDKLQVESRTQAMAAVERRGLLAASMTVGPSKDCHFT